MSKVESYTEQLTMSEMSFYLGENDFGYVYPSYSHLWCMRGKEGGVSC